MYAGNICVVFERAERSLPVGTIITILTKAIIAIIQAVEISAAAPVCGHVKLVRATLANTNDVRVAESFLDPGCACALFKYKLVEQVVRRW